MKYRNTNAIRGIKKIGWIRKYLFFRKEVSSSSLLHLPRMRARATFGFGNEEDVRSIASDPAMDAGNDEQCYLQKLRDGDRLLVARVDRRIVFYLWVVTDRKSLMDKVLLLEPGEIAIERAFTRRDFRGQGLYLYALDFLFPVAATTGISSCLTEIATHNKPMIRTIMKAGFQQVDSHYYYISNCFWNYCVPCGSLAERCIRR